MGDSEGDSEPIRPAADTFELGEAAAAAVYAIGRHAASAEPAVTATMVAIVQRHRVVELVGLEDRLKSLESMSRKVATAIVGVEKEPVTLVEALGSINDAARYTAVIPDRYFERSANLIMDDMARRGLVHVKTKNTFGRSGYQGCNTTWRAPGGLLFEVQFHSPDSWATTKATHGDYEVRRLASDTETRTRMRRKIDRAYAEVQPPRGAHRVRGPVEAPQACTASAIEGSHLGGRRTLGPNVRPSGRRGRPFGSSDIGRG